MKALQKWAPFLLRFSIGWHFLYEGVIKLFSENWTAEGYLKGSYGFLSGLFHALASNEGLLNIIDFLNVWGLILIGLGLLLGIFVRYSSYAGMLLLLLYYFCYPPFGETLFANAEGQHWIINRNLIEIIALGIIVAFPTREFSLMNLFLPHLASKAAGTKASGEKGPDGNEPADKDVNGRRDMLKSLATLPFAGGIFYAAAAKSAESGLDGTTGATLTFNEYNLNDLKGTMPRGKLGNLEVSRLVMGCNLISGYAHSRDLHYVGNLFQHYNTEKKIYETFHLCEQAGVNTTNLVLNNFPFFNNYKKITGSKLQTIAQVHALPDENDPLIQFKQARDFGTTSMYVQGGCADQLVKNQKLEWIQKAVEYTRSQGMMAGIGGHSIQVVRECEAAGIHPDYYFKTVHHDKYWSAHPREFRHEFEVDGKRSLDHNKFHDNIFDIFPEQTVDVFKNIDVPLFGFKVLAGGAIQPEDGFRYAFESGSDFICVGMFDFQVIENVNLVNKILAEGVTRERKWHS